MDRMDHLRGKLLEGDQAVVDPLDVYLGSRAVSSGQKKWFGYFEMTAEQRTRVNPGVRYQMVLDDGRSGEFYVDIHPSNSPGHFTAEFQLIGPIKEKRLLRR